MKKILSLIVLASAISLWSAAATPASAGDLVSRLKDSIARDGRTAVWNVDVSQQNKLVSVSGTVTTREQRAAIERTLTAGGYRIFKNNLSVLADAQPQGKQWALVCVPVASLRTQGKHSAEMATQLGMGTPVRVLDKSDDWYRVICPDDYIAFIPESSIQFMGEEKLKAWKAAKRCIVAAHASRMVESPGSDETVSDLVLSNILEVKGESDGWIKLATPDGREGFAPKNDVAPFDEWAKQDLDIPLIEKTARRMMGAGYLWGGTSTKVTDCSGLTKICYFASGVILQRDASQQTLTGLKLDTSKGWQQLQTGDLLFFGNAKTGRVTHVGMYLRDGSFIHCSGRVKINSLDPQDPSYLYSPLSGSRIAGKVGSKGIVAVRNHPWYF